MAKKKSPPKKKPAATAQSAAPLTIPHALEEAARRHGDRPALIAPGVALSHAQLDAGVSRAAAALRKAGVGPGTTVGVRMETSAMQFLSLMALARLGANSVHLRPELPAAARQALVQQYRVAAVLAEPGREGQLHFDPEWLQPGKAVAQPVLATRDSPWRIVLSSGTTGRHKAVQYLHGSAYDYLRMHAYARLVKPEDRFLCHRGMDAQLILNPTLRLLMVGGAVVFPASRTLAHLVEAIDRDGVTNVVMSPALLRDLHDFVPAGAKPRFPGLARLQLAGSKIPAGLVASSIKRLTPHIWSAYGASEIGLVCLASPQDLVERPESVGRVVEGVEAQVVDARGQPVAAGETGEVRFRRAGMPTGYIDNPELTARAFRDGWFQPGDLGRMDAQGLLTVLGRTDDKMNLDGMKIDPAPIEDALAAHPAVVEACAFGAAPAGMRAALFAAVVPRAGVEEKALIAHVRGRLGPAHTPARIFFVKALPRNENGKVLRAELSRRVGRKPEATPAPVPGKSLN